jgi:hypothetical protein
MTYMRANGCFDLLFQLFPSCSQYVQRMAVFAHGTKFIVNLGNQNVMRLQQLARGVLDGGYCKLVGNLRLQNA